MMPNNFDPYNMLIEINDRLTRMELAHNKLARAFQQTEQELTIALHSLKMLQQKHLQLSHTVGRLQVEAQQDRKNDIS